MPMASSAFICLLKYLLAISPVTLPFLLFAYLLWVDYVSLLMRGDFKKQARDSEGGSVVKSSNIALVEDPSRFPALTSGGS